MRYGRLLFRPDGDGGDGGGGAAGGDGGAGGAAGSDGGAGAQQGAQPPKGAQGGPQGQDGAIKTFSQDELGAIVKRERDAAVKQALKEAKEQAEREKLDETERLKLEKADAEKQAATAIEQANERILRSEARAQLIAKGYGTEQAALLMRAIDLSAVQFVEGEPDQKALETAVDAVVKVLPAAATAGPARSGGDFANKGTDGKRIYTEAEIQAMTTEEYAKVQDDVMAAMAEPGTPRFKPS